uniref:Uncharacterized protein n=1 Tax=Cucumis melo TaxID=3656 RepID=A0A9I9D510_CUCME
MEHHKTVLEGRDVKMLEHCSAQFKCHNARVKNGQASRRSLPTSQRSKVFLTGLRCPSPRTYA